MSNLTELDSKLLIVESQEPVDVKVEEPSTSGMSGDRPQKRAGRRPGRRSSKMDVRAKLERSRQSARECRARKKLRYQYLEDLVANREKAVFALREELEMYKQWCIQLDSGLFPLATLELSDYSPREEVHSEPKKQRLGTDKDHKIPKISANTTAKNVLMDTGHSYAKQEQTFPFSNHHHNGFTKGHNSVNSFLFKGSNSDVCNSKSSNFSLSVQEMGLGGNQEKNKCLDGATGWDNEMCSWTLDGEILRIEPRTNNSVFKGANFSLPTIVEETDQ